MSRLIALVILAVFAAQSAADTEYNKRPPKSPPPGETYVDVDNSINVRNRTSTHTTVKVAPRTEATGGDAKALGEGGDATATIASGAVTVKAGDTGPSNSSLEDSGNSSVTVQGDRYPEQVPSTTLFQNSNMDNCIRVLGFSTATDRGSVILGVPLPRDRTCDIWRAVNEAQENGHILLSYALMCEIKNIRNIWGLERCQQITKTTEDWWVENLPDPPGDYGNPSDSEEDNLVGCALCDQHMYIAEVTEEEYREQHEMVEKRNAQQQNLIDALKQREQKLAEEVKILKAVQQKRLQLKDDQRPRLEALLKENPDG